MPLTLPAPAKLNLVLEVLGRRGDGYHDIRSIVQTIGLHDELSFQTSRTLKLKCNVPSLQAPDNLVMKAVNELIIATGHKGGAEIQLVKRIPWAAGLGGGSSDAATTLIGLNRIWDIGLSSARLMEIAAKVGSDVAFFIRCGCCLVEGRGEKITSLADIDKVWFILLKPDIRVAEGKTGRLYDLLQARHFTTGAHTEKARNYLEREGRIRQGLLYNVFDSVALEAFPGLEAYWKLMTHAGAEKIHMAGSGPTLYAQFHDEAKALEVAEQLKQCGAWIHVAASSGRGELAG